MNETTEALANTLQLSPVLDLSAASPLAAELQTRRGSAITIVASDVQRISAPGLQVLLSAQLTWAADGASFRVVDCSPEFIEGVALLGAVGLGSETNTLEMFA